MTQDNNGLAAVQLQLDTATRVMLPSRWGPGLDPKALV